MPLLNNSVYNRRGYNQTVVVVSAVTYNLTLNIAGSTTIGLILLYNGATVGTVTYMKYRLLNGGAYNSVKLGTGSVVVPATPTVKSVGQLFNSLPYNSLFRVYVAPDTRSYLNGGYNSEPYQTVSLNDALNIITLYTINNLVIAGKTTMTVSLNILRPHYAVYDIKFIMPRPYTIKMMVAN